MFRTALRNVVAHKGRLCMTVLAVLLGVAFVAGTLVFSDTIGDAYKQSASRSFDDVSVAVTDDNKTQFGYQDRGRRDPRLTEEMMAELRALPGVEGARGVAEGFAGVLDRDGDAIGGSWSTTGTNFVPGKDGSDPRFPMRSGAGPTTAGEIALDAYTAERGGFRVGDTVRVAGAGPVTVQRLTGVFATDDQRVRAGGSLVLFDTATAQRLYQQSGEYSEIHLRAAEGTDERQLLASAARLLPKSDNLEVHTGRELARQQADQIEEGTRRLTTALLAFAAIALFVGCFIIANTFTMLVAQRTRELALLRAVGAGRGQVVRALLYEAAAVGLIASAVGLALGVGIAAAMRELLFRTGALLPDGPIVIAPDTVLAAFAVGLGVTVLAAWLPARRASRIPPVAALNSVERPADHKSLRGRNTVGTALAGLGALLVAYGASTGDDRGRAPVAFGVFLVLVGVIVLTPLLSRPLIGLARPLLDGRFGAVGRLARGNAVRNPRRTAATTSALTIGLTLITGLSVIGASVRDTVERDAIREVAADYRVQLGTTLPLDPGVAPALEAVPGVNAVTPLVQDYITVEGRTTDVIGVDAATAPRLLNFDISAGTADALSRGEVLVEAKAAKKHGWQVGSVLGVEYSDGTRERLTVGGVHADLDQLGDVTLPVARLLPHAVSPEILSVLVKTATGDTPENTRALERAVGGNPLIQVNDRDAIRTEISREVDLLLSIMYGLLGMAVLIAVLGVVNTLAMSVFERRREIGMLRAIGLDGAGVRRMIRLESMVISMLGTVLGIVLGGFLAWGVLGTLKSLLPNLGLVIPWGSIAVFLALGVIVGLVAALWPARRATRADILAAIGAE